METEIKASSSVNMINAYGDLVYSEIQRIV